MDGWVYGCVGGCKAACADGLVDRRQDVWMNGWGAVSMIGWSNG